jgi:hypothetical protein
MARGSPEATIGYPQSPNLGGQMLEWRPRLIFLLLVIVVFALAAGFTTTEVQVSDIQPLNWEW